MQSFLRRLTEGHLRGALIGSIASLASKLTTAGIGFGVTILIARKFGATGSGVWVLGTTILMIAASISVCGLDYSTTRAVAVYRSAERWAAARGWAWTSVGIILTTGLVTSVAVWAGAGLIEIGRAHV